MLFTRFCPLCPRAFACSLAFGLHAPSLHTTHLACSPVFPVRARVRAHPARTRMLRAPAPLPLLRTRALSLVLRATGPGPSRAPRALLSWPLASSFDRWPTRRLSPTPSSGQRALAPSQRICSTVPNVSALLMPLYLPQSVSPTRRSHRHSAKLRAVQRVPPPATRPTPGQPGPAVG